MMPPSGSESTPKADEGARGEREVTDRSQSAYEKLRELIVRGRLAPGSRVVETEVAERLGVSRTPVRSALQRLRQEGYIIPAGDGARSGSSVAPLTSRDARELLFIMGQVEALAARGCARLEEEERQGLGGELRRINGELDGLTVESQPDPNSVFDLDDRFHQCFFDAGAGPRLEKLHETVKPQTERYIRFYVKALIDEIQTSVLEHRRIVERIVSGNPGDAELAVQANWRNAAHRLSSVIEKMGEWGTW